MAIAETQVAVAAGDASKGVGAERAVAEAARAKGLELAVAKAARDKGSERAVANRALAEGSGVDGSGVVFGESPCVSFPLPQFIHSWFILIQMKHR